LLILDTGLRVDEALSLSRVDSVDLDSLLVTVRGKGGRQRVVPMSLKGRAVLCRYFKRHEPPRGDLVFFSRIGGKIEQRNALRAFKDICERLKLEGTRCSFHTLRHTFATNYLRAGGNVVMLQRILGHARLEMTMRYVHLQTADLTAVHDRFSPLSRGV
jgi:integrase/recombinase XerD